MSETTSDTVTRSSGSGVTGDALAGGPVTVARPRKSWSFDTRATSEAVHALHDLNDGLSNWKLWTMMGWLDIKRRYRRSVLGPFWLTLSMAVTVLTLGVLYGSLFNLDSKSYVPFLCLGMVCWEFVSKSITEGCRTFLDLEHLIKQIRLPLSTHVAGVVWRNTATFLHNIVIFLVVAVIFQVWPGAIGLLVIPGLILLVLNLFWMTLLLALICARFRDVPQIVQTAVQLLFFVTPVFWKPEMLKGLGPVVEFNPFFHMIELVRAPLLGQAPTALNWIVMLATLALGGTLTFRLFARFRKRVPYWL